MYEDFGKYIAEKKPHLYKRFLNLKNISNETKEAESIKNAEETKKQNYRFYDRLLKALQRS